MIQTPRPNRPLCEADVEEAEADLDELIEARLVVLGVFLVRCVYHPARVIWVLRHYILTSYDLVLPFVLGG